MTTKTPTLFPRLSEAQLDKLSGCQETQFLRLNPGEVLFAEGDAYDFYVVLEGAVKITKNFGESEMVLVVHRRGEFIGELSLLTGEPAKVTGHIVEPTVVMRFDLAHFQQLIANCEQMRDILLPALAERSRDLETQMRQQDKLAALGKLSAGLAHELNNPAAASTRAAHQLRQALSHMQIQMLQVCGERFSRSGQKHLQQLQHQALEYKDTSPLSPLEQSDREDELGDWLEEHGINRGWQIAPTLISGGIGIEQLQPLTEVMSSDALAEALDWLEASININSLVEEVESSATRITELVKAVKSYSYMDRAPVQEIDLHGGLEDTLTILHHKIKYGIEVKREYDHNLPKIFAYGGELNQVWTNLIDNAVDAMSGEGSLTVRTSRENDSVLVEIIDSGPGIPAQIQGRIFEPFFTTKDVGKGSGLGLDIVRRIVVQKHQGSLRFDSEPGRTNFQVRLPLTQK